MLIQDRQYQFLQFKIKLNMFLEDTSLMLLVWQLFIGIIIIFFIYFLIRWYRRTMGFYEKSNRYFDNHKKESNNN